MLWFLPQLAMEGRSSSSLQSRLRQERGLTCHTGKITREYGRVFKVEYISSFKMYLHSVISAHERGRTANSYRGRKGSPEKATTCLRPHSGSQTRDQDLAACPPP